MTDNWPPLKPDTITIMRDPCEGVDQRVQFPDGSRFERLSVDPAALTFSVRWNVTGGPDSMAHEWAQMERARMNRALSIYRPGTGARTLAHDPDSPTGP